MCSDVSLVGESVSSATLLPLRIQLCLDWTLPTSLNLRSIAHPRSITPEGDIGKGFLSLIHSLGAAKCKAHAA